MTVRKVGHPAQPEFALGAVSETGVVDPPDLPAQLAEPELARAREQATRLRSGRAAIDLRGRTAIVVDDGLATGHTMAAALESADAAGAARVVMAVPVAAGPGFRELAARFEAFALEVVEPPAFFAVGQFYADFEQVPDEAVVALLAA
jgi:putative phosphoribosyl transferase